MSFLILIRSGMIDCINESTHDRWIRAFQSPAAMPVVIGECIWVLHFLLSASEIIFFPESFDWEVILCSPSCVQVNVVRQHRGKLIPVVAHVHQSKSKSQTRRLDKQQDLGSFTAYWVRSGDRVKSPKVRNPIGRRALQRWKKTDDYSIVWKMVTVPTH
jgi:hypothetical protein